MARKGKKGDAEDDGDDVAADAGPSKAELKQAKKAAKKLRKRTLAVRSVARPAIVGAILLAIAAQYLPK